MNHHATAIAGLSVNTGVLVTYLFGHLPDWAAGLAMAASLAQLLRFAFDAARWWRGEQKH